MSDAKLPPITGYPRAEKTSGAVHGAMVAAEAIASALPGVSYASQQLLDHYVRRPLEDRREAWFDRIGEGLKRLEERPEGFDPHRLAGNEEFVSIVFEATQIAMKTHREEKREALRNAVMNTALGLSLDEVVRGTFMSLIDRFSPLHLELLRVSQDPTASPEIVRHASNMALGGLMGIIRYGLRQPVDDAALRQAFKDLKGADLISGDSGASVSEDRLTSKWTTDLGDRFLAFITDPTRA